MSKDKPLYTLEKRDVFPFAIAELVLFLLPAILTAAVVRAARFLYYSQDLVCSVYSRVGIYIGLRCLVVYQVEMGNGGSACSAVHYS